MHQIVLINKVIFYSKLLMAFTLCSFFVCLLITFPFASYFSIPLQVSAHIFTIICAAIFKVSVVSLMAANKERGAFYSTFNSNSIEA